MYNGELFCILKGISSFFPERSPKWEHRKVIYLLFVFTRYSQYKSIYVYSTVHCTVHKRRNINTKKLSKKYTGINR